MNQKDTICAVSTPPGKGGIAVIRISGADASDIVAKAWLGKNFIDFPRLAFYGSYVSIEGSPIDDVILTYFKAPVSFTGEDTIEISVHGSKWIQKEIINDLIRRGTRIADPGEFTMRAFVNGKMDLAQAEGVADVIASETKASHKLAVSQMKGDFSKELSMLRNQLIEFTSLLELELDFSEEDVEFANRENLKKLLREVRNRIKNLADSFSQGKVIKEGIPVVIAGVPNAGKSSLLNLLSNEEKAIVTDIPGTTRDLIEEKIEIEGILFRFIDTAGLHETTDKIENIGISKAKESIKNAVIIIWMIDPTGDVSSQSEELNVILNEASGAHLIILENKIDLRKDITIPTLGGLESVGIIPFSTKTKTGLDELLSKLREIALSELPERDIVVTNARHYEALLNSLQSIDKTLEDLESGVPSDFVAQDIRETIHHLGTITGTITTDDLLQTIFSRFCIGK